LAQLFIELDAGASAVHTITFASFTCQPQDALEDRMEENQRFRELAIVANPLENRLFLASVMVWTAPVPASGSEKGCAKMVVVEQPI
jgi:hypothetical protein